MKNQKGITLIALIITIIVMLILVGVSVTVAINTGLFKTTSGVSRNTQNEIDKEKERSSGKVIIGGKTYGSLTDYVELPKGITKVEDEEGKKALEKDEWDLTKVTAITDGTGTIPLPNGFSILKVEGKENTIENGIVIKDDKLGNEFVWVPVLDYKNYEEDVFNKISNDKPTYILETYGDLFGTMNSDPDFDAVFTYEADSRNIQRSIVTYGGFYVGRYETTYDLIDETTKVVSGIGVKPGKNVLKGISIIKAEENIPNDYYLWWGIYKVQKDMYANNENVGSLMISSKQWDAIMAYTKYGYTKRSMNTYTNEPDLSGSAYKNSKPARYDEAKNIYDLAGNLFEWTMNEKDEDKRIYRGGFYRDDDYSAESNAANDTTYWGNYYIGSRTTLYIK